MILTERFTGLDPRTKLVLVMVLSSLGVILQEVLLLGIVWFLTLSLAALFGVGWRPILRRSRMLFGIFAAMAIIQSVFTTGGHGFLWLGPVSVISSLGLERAGGVVLRLLIVVVSASIMATSSPREIVQGLSQWRIPYELAFMVAVAIRFLPLLRQEALETLTALQLRGVALEQLPWGRRLRVYSYLLMPMIAGVMSKSKELALAVEMRGFRAYSQRTAYRVLRPRPFDYAVGGGMLVGMGLFLWIVY